MELKSTNAAKANKLKNFLIFLKRARKGENFRQAVFSKFWNSSALNKTWTYGMYFPKYYPPDWAMEKLYPAAFRDLCRFWTTAKEQKDEENVLEVFIFQTSSIHTNTEVSAEALWEKALYHSINTKRLAVLSYGKTSLS